MRLVMAGYLDGADQNYRHIAQGLGLECAPGDCVGLSQLAYRLARSPAPDLVVVMTEPAGEDDWADVVKYSSENAGVPVLVAGPMTDPHRPVRAINAGARQYLDQDQLREELGRALERLHGDGLVQGRRGRVYAVTAATTGSGVTTAACGLAFALGAKHAGEVILAEVGSGVPELALNLDLEVRHGIRMLAADWQRSDARMVAGAMVAHPDGVNILAQPADSLTPPELEAGVMKQLTVLARSMAEFVVFDMGHLAGDAALETMKMAANTLVATRLDVPSLRRTRKYLKLLRDRDVPTDRIRVVANRYGQAGQVNWRKVEEMVEVPVVAWVPDDPRTVNQALNAGKPVRRLSRSGLARSFDKLAAALAKVAHG